MALVTEFQPVAGDRQSIHKPVTCGWKVFEEEGKRVLQLDTYGSADRVIAGKGSQSLQFDRAAASELLALIDHAFPDIRQGRQT